MTLRNKKPMRAPAHLKLRWIKTWRDLTRWLTANCLNVNATEIQADTGESPCPYKVLGDKCIEVKRILRILGVTLYWDLSSETHVAIMLKKAHAKIATPRRIKRFVPLDVMISLYKAYV